MVQLTFQAEPVAVAIQPADTTTGVPHTHPLVDVPRVNHGLQSSTDASQQALHPAITHQISPKAAVARDIIGMAQVVLLHIQAGNKVRRQITAKD
ncbi:MAG: hypothetical protein UV64_C0037G0002 [Parcubacteria group bacterium GW2011_GWC1_43_11b]|nr:MAG: hypothetical protein UV64_C0037G0002 [Parcubacteria group bacterium GW2011_GWC1_43_11b]